VSVINVRFHDALFAICHYNDAAIHLSLTTKGVGLARMHAVTDDTDDTVAGTGQGLPWAAERVHKSWFSRYITRPRYLP
jgi:hypothetical protein